MKKIALIMGAVAFVTVPALAASGPGEKAHHHKKIMRHQNPPGGEKSEHSDKGGNDKGGPVGSGEKGGGDKGGGGGGSGK